MKKKLIIFTLLALCVFSLTACGKKEEINLANYTIEERDALYTANDDIYSVSLSSGLREIDYNLDGIINEKTNFALLTFNRNNNQPLANDTYSYSVKINEEIKTGFLEKNPTNNSYSADLETEIPINAIVEVKISFTGYNFNQTLNNTYSEFTVDKSTALNIANNQLSEEVKNILKNKNTSIEVVMKILKDYSDTELKTYYWYVGAVSNEGETLGVLIDANSGEVIAKKV